MDTKWKSIRRVLSFIIFFLGVSLTLGNLSGVIRYMPRNAGEWASGSLLEEDYQRTDEFRQYISDCLENLLSIAVNGGPVGYRFYDAYDTYYTYSDGENGVDTGDIAVVEDLELLEQTWWERGDMDIGGFFDRYGRIAPKPSDSEQQDSLTEEEREKRIEEREAQIAEYNQRLTESYLESMKEDKNLLYTIYYDGKLLYSNTDLLAADGSMQMPEGYNFLLYFDGEKARIVKDGKEEDIYGDGYFRWEEGEWYVPGYRNFPANEEMKKAVVSIAAAKEPLLYTIGITENRGYRQAGNTLYYMQYHLLTERSFLIRNLIGLTAGLALLVLSCFCRKSRREITGKLAAFQGKIWVECKILLVAAVLLLCLKEYMENGSGGSWIWQEISYAYADGGLPAIVGYADYLLTDLRGWIWWLLFWTAYLIGNDLKHNKKVWRQGLIAKFAKCCRAFSAKGINQPFARQMIRRNGILMGIAAGFETLMLLLTAGVLWIFDSRRTEEWMTFLFALCLFGIALFMLAVYLLGKKNVEAAKEVDALAERIGEICSGDYSAKDSAGQDGAGLGKGVGESVVAGEESGGAAAGVPTGGLEAARAQLENIRQGMADAVDEQMKSERMKVELIANVSHDLKTPLTSIISYVQFLKEEEGLPEHVKDYVRILDEKSQRLKNMVQDVFAVSKAASGELPMCMESLDFGKLLRQTLADMDEEIRNSGVSFRTELPEEPVMIMADGQRMYRVFQNLFQNALKYSLDGSRVYVTLKAEGAAAVASVKNTSHMELDEDKNFTERFFRGDKSRTDGGSGLGLSIAQSFTEACGGQFELEFNADLFIVRISFDTL